MHVGEKPYVVTASSSMNAYRGPLAWGQVELSSRVLTFDAVSSMLVQILPGRSAAGAHRVRRDRTRDPAHLRAIVDRFTVVAARGGEDVWLEVRRRPIEPTESGAETPAATPHVEVPAEHAVVPSARRARRSRSRSLAACRSEAKAVDESPAVAAAHEPLVEPVTEAPHEVPLVADDRASFTRRPSPVLAARAAGRSILAIPGQAAEEIQLERRSGQRDPGYRRRAARRADGGRGRRDARAATATVGADSGLGDEWPD